MQRGLRCGTSGLLVPNNTRWIHAAINAASQGCKAPTDIHSRNSNHGAYSHLPFCLPRRRWPLRFFHRGSGPMAKGKKSDDSTQSRRGRKGHFDQTKLSFLDDYKTRWENARIAKTTTPFYNLVTTDFIIRFGYGMPLGDVSKGSPAPKGELSILNTVDGEKVPGTAGLTKEEEAVKIDYYTKLRTVRFSSLSLNSFFDGHRYRNWPHSFIISTRSSAARASSMKPNVYSRLLRRRRTRKFAGLRIFNFIRHYTTRLGSSLFTKSDWRG